MQVVFSHVGKTVVPVVLDPSTADAARSFFPKRWRLQKRRDFVNLQRSAENRYHGRHFTILAGKKLSRHGQLGITASKKVGNAVQRNRAKRLIRETVRQSGWFPLPRDVVVIAKRGAADLTFNQVRHELRRFGRRVTSC